MLKRIVLIVTLHFMTLAHGQTTEDSSKQRLLLVGDSLSAGYGLPLEVNWVNQLAQQLQSQGIAMTVINDSISGDTTAAALSRLPASLEKHQPQWLMIALGANDGLRGLSLEAMEENLAQMIALGRDAEANILLIGMDLPRNYGEAFRTAFMAVYQSLAEQYDVPLMASDQFSDLIGNPDLTQTDGIHPNETAQPIILNRMFDFVYPHLEATLSTEDKDES